MQNGTHALRRARLLLEDLRDPEIQHFDGSIRGHQDVGRLEVAVENQVLVGVVDRGADIAKHTQAICEAEPPSIAVLRHGHAFGQFHDEVAVTRGDPRIHQSDDVWMIQLREDPSFLNETAVGFRREETSIGDLDGDVPIERAILPLGAIDDPHPTAPDHFAQHVGPQCRTDGRRQPVRQRQQSTAPADRGE